MADKIDRASTTTRQLRARRRRLACSLPDLEGLIAGSVVEQGRRCGKEGCRCASGELHGPYTYVVLPRAEGRTRSVYVPAAAAEAVRRGAGLSAQVRDIVGEISAINLELLARGSSPEWRWWPRPWRWWPTWRPRPWRPAVRGTEKITAGHRERIAVVYIRQSSLAQVREHTESTARQYGLADEAVRLGWARAAVEVIDADLGLSGRSADGRRGFADLVSRVCLGEVGAIFGLEVSRLARSSADLSRLLELARLTDTLVVDADGIYDLANFNDRLLLGLKGTMSEAELHLLAGRLQGAKRAAAERGELRFPLPVGYVYDDEGATVIDPDGEVQAAVADLFAAFRAGGSAYQVVAAFVGRRFPLRAYGGVWAGQLRWGRLTHSRVLGLMANPA